MLAAAILVDFAITTQYQSHWSTCGYDKILVLLSGLSRSLEFTCRGRNTTSQGNVSISIILIAHKVARKAESGHECVGMIADLS